MQDVRLDSILIHLPRIWRLKKQIIKLMRRSLRRSFGKLSLVSIYCYFAVLSLFILSKCYQNTSPKRWRFHPVGSLFVCLFVLSDSQLDHRSLLKATSVILGLFVVFRVSVILDQYHFIVLSVKVFCDADEMVSHKLLRPLNAWVQ